MIREISRFLNGGFQDVQKELEQKMHRAAEELNFERARELRDLIQHIEAVMAKQNIIMKDNLDRDVFGYAADKGMMCVQIFFVRQGKLIERMFPSSLTTGRRQRISFPM